MVGHSSEVRCFMHDKMTQSNLFLVVHTYMKTHVIVSSNPFYAILFLSLLNDLHSALCRHRPSQKGGNSNSKYEINYEKNSTTQYLYTGLHYSKNIVDFESFLLRFSSISEKVEQRILSVENPLFFFLPLMNSDWTIQHKLTPIVPFCTICSCQFQ